MTPEEIAALKKTATVLAHELPKRRLSVEGCHVSAVGHGETWARCDYPEIADFYAQLTPERVLFLLSRVTP